MKSSVLIVAEGDHELAGGHADAALTTLVRRLLGDRIDLQVSSKPNRKVSRHMHAGKGDRLGRKFIGIVKFAEREGFDAVVILMDHDGDDTRLKSATYAQEARLTSFPRAVGIAVRSFDAWFLADHVALSSVLATRVDMQPDPEAISDPKKVCRSLSDAAGRDWRIRDLYSSVALIADLRILRARCPTGFVAFADRVEGLKSALLRDF